jgi:streptogramin lyase
VEELRPGSVFAGHRIEAVLGAGGMGVVYRAVHVGLERTVALKLIAPERATDPVFRERFRRESHLAATLDHPSILAVYDSGEHEGLLYVTMRLVDGPDLERQLRVEGPMDPPAAVEVIGHVAAALDVAHAAGLVHRDVKPANVLLEPPRVFLGDFGIAKRLGGPGGPTATAEWLGTVDYAAPEQISEARAEPRSDVYALAGVLFATLTGRAPYPHQDIAAVMWAHVNAPPPPLDTVDNPALEAVIHRGMAKDPDDRFDSAGELAREAQRAVSGRAAARTVTAGAPVVPVAKRVPRRLWIAAAVVVAAAALAAVLVLALGGDEGSALDARVVVDEIELPGPPVDVAILGEEAWVAIVPEEEQTPGALVSVKDMKVSEPLELDAEPEAIAAGEGAVWVLLGGENGGLQQIDPETRRLVGGPIDVDVGDGSRVAIGDGALWVTDTVDETVVKVDPERARAVETIKAPAGLDGPLAVGEGMVWILGSTIETNNETVHVTPIDESTGSAGEQIRVGEYGDVGGIAAGEGSVWVGDSAGGAIRRIDPGTRKITDSLDLQEGANEVAIGDGAVWALDGALETVMRIDPATNEFSGRPVRVAVGGPARLVTGDGAAWVTDGERWTLLRLSY